MKRKSIPLKNYIIYVIIVIVSILAVFYFKNWYQTYQQGRLNTPIINNYISELKYDDFKNYALENENFIVYVGSTNCENCRNFEIEFSNYIQKHTFKHDVVYLNITDNLVEDTEYVSTFQDNYNGSKTLKLGNEVPPTIYQFENGKIKDVVRPSEQGVLDINKVKTFFEKKHYVSEE